MWLLAVPELNVCVFVALAEGTPMGGAYFENNTI
jgi:hypothetical protein